MISRKRSRYGRRMMLLTRSVGIVDVVFSTGTTPLFGSFSSACPGWQST
jgi:hypothetical protein